MTKEGCIFISDYQCLPTFVLQHSKMKCIRMPCDTFFYNVIKSNRRFFPVIGVLSFTYYVDNDKWGSCDEKSSFWQFFSIIVMEFTVDVKGCRRSIKAASKNWHFRNSMGVKNQIYKWNLFSAKYKNENLWLERNYHSRSWNSDVVPYDKVGEILSVHLQRASFVYFKGLDKANWLKKVLSPNTHLIHLKDLGYPSLTILKQQIDCIDHDHTTRVSSCSVRKVKLLKIWMREIFDHCFRH